jgi:hypothetical protein
MFCVTFKVEDNVIPILEKPVFHDTDEVRVDCVLVCGLYIEFRLLCS